MMAKNFIPMCCAEGKWVYLSFHGHEYTLHPNSARKLAQMLIDAANNTEESKEHITYDDACMKVAGILAGE